MSMIIHNGYAATDDRARKPVFFIDLETGGFSCDKNALLSISICLVEQTRTIKPQTWYILPERGLYVHSQAAAVNGFSMNLWREKGAMNCADAMENMMDYIAATKKKLSKRKIAFAAHNANFDKRFLGAALNRHGYKSPDYLSDWFCTYQTMRAKGYRHARLDDACNVFKIKNLRRGIHASDEDVIMGTKILLKQISKKWGIYRL